MDMATRLRAAMEQRGLRQNQVADISGVPEKTVSRILSGDTKNPRIDTLQGIAGALDVTVGWALGERGYEFSPDDRDQLRRVVRWANAVLAVTDTHQQVSEANATPVVLTRKPPMRARRYEQSHDASATRWREIFGDSFEDEKEEIPERFERKGAHLIFRARGDSMEGDHILHRDLLYVREGSDLRSAQGQIVVCIVDRSPYVKRLDVAGKRIRLTSSNGSTPMEFDGERTEWTLVGVVVGWSHDVR